MRTDTLGTTTYTYDALYRLQAVKDPYDERVSYGHDGVGNRDALVYPTDDTVTQTFDALNQLTQIEHSNSSGELLARYVYALDQVGNRVQATETLSTPGTGLITTTITYTYDSLYRLTEADYSSGEKFEYVYDAVGNRTSYTATITSTTVTTESYDAANPVIAGRTAPSSGANCRLVNAGAWHILGMIWGG